MSFDIQDERWLPMMTEIKTWASVCRREQERERGLNIVKEKREKCPLCFTDYQEYINVTI